MVDKDSKNFLCAVCSIDCCIFVAIFLVMHPDKN